MVGDSPDQRPEGLAPALGRWLQGLSPDDIPPLALETVRRATLDYVGVMLGGRDEPVVGHVQAMLQVSTEARPGLVPLLLDRGYTTPMDAAWIDSVAAHALDYDDTALDGHPSAVLLPVVQALGRTHQRELRDLHCAYVAGFEIWAELARREPDKLHGKGWHPTAVYGCVAAAAAAAWMLGLDQARAAHALGIAASMAGGVMANFGSTTKPLQVGLAARNGIFAVQMATQGVTASADALDGPRGLLAALSPAGRVRLHEVPDVGRRWHILERGLSIKRYPVCYALHRAVDAALSLHPRLTHAPAIHRIVVELGTLQAQMLRTEVPTRAQNARFSASFAIACALSRGHLDLADLHDASVADFDLQALMRLVELRELDQPDPEEPLFAIADRVEVWLRSGEVLHSEPVTRAKGHAHRPLDDVDLRHKFLDCAGRTMAPGLAQALWQQLNLDDGVTAWGQNARHHK